MRIKARPGLHYAPVPGGVYLAGARTQFVMRGSDLLFAVADVCVPLLEDGATEDDLVAALGTEQARPAVRHLTGGLRTHGLLLEPDRLTVPEPPSEVRDRHGESLALLESVCADPYAAFAALRAVTVVLDGPPEAVGPAARGLVRAGVGRVIVRDAAGDPDILVDVVLRCVGADEELELPPPGGRPVLVMPVLLDNRLLMVGPVVRDDAGRRAWLVRRARAMAWAGPDGPPRPVADALAGALAAQLLFETLTGIADDGEAHVVYGPDLAADRIGAGRAAGPEPVWWRLDDTEAVPVPEPEDAVELVGAVTQRWTGLVEATPSDTLPQIPLALREAVHRDGPAGPIAAWGADQRSATAAVALSALRRLSDPEVACELVGAAGLTAETWLLDGALRLLAPGTLELRTVAADELDPECRRLWRELHRVAPGEWTVGLRHVPGLDWLLARVESPGSASSLAWGPDTDTAVRYAIATALARAQLELAAGPGDRVDPVNTDALSGTGGETVASLRKQLGARPAADGYRGRRHTPDPVLGAIPLWFGPVGPDSADAY